VTEEILSKCAGIVKVLNSTTHRPLKYKSALLSACCLILATS